jgi:hypothetical protein
MKPGFYILFLSGNVDTIAMKSAGKNLEIVGGYNSSHLEVYTKGQ